MSERAKDNLAKLVLAIPLCIAVAFLCGGYVVWWWSEPLAAAMSHVCLAALAALAWAMNRVGV